MPRVLFNLSILAMLLWACVPPVQPTPLPIPPDGTAPAVILTPVKLQVKATDQQYPTVTTQPTMYVKIATSTPLATNSSTHTSPTPSTVDCLKAGGEVEQLKIDTSLLPDPLVFRVYIPPCYDEDPARSYPVLYLFHGQSFNDDQWERLGVPAVADRLIAAGEMAPFIAVMPRDRVWKEPADDNFGKAVVQALVPWIDKNYRTIPDRAHRAVGGLSRGAAWAAHLGLEQWKLFGTIGMHSGFVFHSDVLPVQDWLKGIPQGETPRIYMDIGNADRPDITEGAVWLEGLLTKKGIPHEWYMFIGQHNEDYWSAHVEDYLRFYTKEWATNP